MVTHHLTLSTFRGKTIPMKTFTTSPVFDRSSLPLLFCNALHRRYQLVYDMPSVEIFFAQRE
jgi:hypothetical protein